MTAESPHILLPYQRRWVADAAPVKVAEKSRRVGFSWAEAADAALYAASGEGANVYYMSYAQDMTKQFIGDVAFWARQYGLAASQVEELVLRDEDRDVQVYQVRFDSGHVVQALSSSPRQLRSKGAPGERVVLDEFAFVDDQAELLKAAIAFLMWGGSVRILSTHNGADNPFGRLVEDIRAGKKPYSLHRVTLDDAIQDGLYERICLVQGKPYTTEGEAAWRQALVDFYGEGADEELFCVPRRGAGRYLPRAIVEQCMHAGIPAIRLALADDFATWPEARREAYIEDWCQDHVRVHLEAASEHLKSFYGMDFARSGDLTVVIPAQEERDLVRRALFVLELKNVPFEQQRQILFYLADRLPRFAGGAMDATGNGAYLAEVAAQRYGFERIHQVKLSAAWYLEQFPRYKAALEDRKIMLPEDADILDDHGDVVLHNGVPLVPQGKTRKGSSGEQRHGDAAIAGVLLWFASLHAGAPIEFQSAGPRQTAEALAAYTGEVASGTPIDHGRGYGVVRGGRSLRGYV